MRKKLSLLSLLVIPFLVLLVASPASAQAENYTETVHGVTETFSDVNPCTGEPATIELTYNAVFHITTDPNGSEHVTGTQTGTVTLTHDDPSLPSYTGRFTVWFGGNLNPKTEGFWFTFNVKATGSDGSTLSLNAVEQLHVSATGETTVHFEKLNCR